jgi:hypothetical protein
MNRPTRLLTALASFACAVLSACGGGAGSSSYSSSAASATPASSTSPGTSATSTTDSVTPTYSLSGVITGFTAATVTTSGTATATAAADSSGNFSFASLAAGSYTVTPAQTGYVYTPVSRAETLSTASITDVVFNATANTAATYSISGHVSGPVIAGVTVTLNGTNIGSAVSDLGGNYSFSGLVSGTYTVNATRSGYTFTAPLIVSLGGADSTGNDFTASAAAAGGISFAAVSPLPQATVGTPYQTHVAQSTGGGVSPYHYQSGPLDDGTPPLGMILNPNGEVTGTATVPGVYDFSVCAVDATGEISTCEPTSLTVVAAPVDVTPAPTPAEPTPVPPTPVAAVTLSASPASITAGAGSTLTWSSTNATTCTASGGWSGAEATSGAATVKPTSSTTYTLTCSDAGGVGKASVLVTVTPATPVVPTVTLSASTTTITAGSSATLKWSSKNAAVCSGSGGWSGNQGTSGSVSVAPKSTTTYGLSCSSSSGSSAEASTKITVNTQVVAPTPAPTVTLTASQTSIKSGGTSTLTWTSKNADSCTATGGWSGAQADSGTQSVSPASDTTYTLSCSGAGGTTQVSTTVDVTTATAGGTSWVYYNGSFDWPGDFDFAAVANYSDTSGDPLSGARDIKVTSSPYGGWLPYAQNWDFNSAPYTKLTFSLKPTRAGQRWQVYFVKVGDIPVGIALDVSSYGPAPVVGQWATYTIPLKDLGVLGKPIYKFAIQDQTGANGNTWYVDNVGFVP